MEVETRSERYFTSDGGEQFSVRMISGFLRRHFVAYQIDCLKRWLIITRSNDRYSEEDIYNLLDARYYEWHECPWDIYSEVYDTCCEEYMELGFDNDFDYLAIYVEDDEIQGFWNEHDGDLDRALRKLERRC